ncbi:helix-turn-helix domain-containing protein [Streptomyces sp. NPDC054933]
MDRLAHQACQSRRTLIRRFHDETGLPPMRWLLDARIDRARELLEVTQRRPRQPALRARRPGRCLPSSMRGSPRRDLDLIASHAGELRHSHLGLPIGTSIRLRVELRISLSSRQ